MSCSATPSLVLSMKKRSLPSSASTTIFSRPVYVTNRPAPYTPLSFTTEVVAELGADHGQRVEAVAAVDAHRRR